MSSCCNNPYVVNSAKGRPYFNPSEVRLYGRKAFCPSEKDRTEDLRARIAEVGITDEDMIKKITRVASEYGSYSKADPIELSRDASTDEEAFIRKSIKLSIKECYLLIYAGPDIEINSLGIIYGYAFEGHCYKLPKPTIMYLPNEPTEIKGGDCGCDCGYVPELGYVVWAIDKLERVLGLDVRSESLKTLILDENLPGNRSPLTYSQSYALSTQRSRD